MILDRITKFSNDARSRGTSIYAFGRDVYRESMRLYNEHFGEKQEEDAPSSEVQGSDLGKNQGKHFKNPSQDDPIESAKQTSLHSHKLKQQAAGEKFNSNMSQRNYNNHQGH